ncbi:MAG: T9SS type A sorting domain-containing protein [Candidatus Kryptoniota bacterium]
MKSIYQFLFVMFCLLTCASSLRAQWVQTGPLGGNIHCSAINGTNLFAGTSDGVFVSTNNGSSWYAINDGLTNLNVATLSFGGGYLFAGTGDGIFLLTNFLSSWTVVDTELTTNNTVMSLAAVAYNYVFAGTSAGIFQLANNGISWTAVKIDSTDTYVYSLVFSGEFDNGSPVLFAGTYAGVLNLTSANGTTWTAVNTDLPSYAYVTSLAISPNGASGTNLFAGTDGDGIFLYANNGWTQIDSGLTGLDAYVASLAASGTNLLAGTYFGGVFLSTNSGTSWTNVFTVGPRTPVGEIPVRETPVWGIAISDTLLFAGTSTGVFVSTNNGSSWATANSGLTNLQVPALTVSGTNLFAGTSSPGLAIPVIASYSPYSNNYFDGSSGGGVFLSTDSGASWSAVNTGLTNTAVSAFAVSPNGAGDTNIFAGTYGGGVFLSTNNGTKWTQVSKGLTNTYVLCLAVSPNGAGGTNLFAGTTGGVFLSTNNGISWTAVDSGLGNPGVYALAVSPNGAGGTNVFAGTGAGFFLSTNNGTNWTQVSTGWGNIYVEALVVSDTNLFAGTNIGVFRSTNNGKSWYRYITGLTNTDVYSLAVSDTNLFAGTFDGGVFLSTNNGTSWTQVDTGLVGSFVYSLAVSGSNLFAGTLGVWRRPLSEMITAVKQNENNVPSQFSISQNYPNPFNPSTVIGYQLPVNGFVTLKVFDILGREVKTLVNEHQNVGSYTAKLDGSRLASGVYFYRIDIQGSDGRNFVSTKKALLMK